MALFAQSALGHAVSIDLTVPAAGGDGGYRPRRGVGGASGAGGVDWKSFLVEDAARARVDKGFVAPELRAVERRLGEYFDPPFAHVDVANKRELFHKQFMASFSKRPTVRELSRAENPADETYADKRKRIVAEPFFLGRRAQVFVRQGQDGAVLEIALRSSSGFRAFDDEAIEAVAHILDGKLPPGVVPEDGQVRTLWQLEATAYVVYSTTPAATFDESTGKVEWVYPLEKKVDRKVKLMAVY